MFGKVTVQKMLGKLNGHLGEDDYSEPLEILINSANKNNYTTILIADHGNCETMINPDGTPNTAHTTNPVPVILIDKDLKNIKSGILGDIAPTILKLMGIKKPANLIVVDIPENKLRSIIFLCD